MTLAELGWSEFFAAPFAQLAGAGWTPARVTLELKGFFEVTDAEGARLGECTGKFGHDFRQGSGYPVIGDWVAVSPQPGDPSRAAIHAVLPRRTRFSRQAAGDHVTEQVVAANIDTLFLVSSLDGNYNRHRLERYLAAAWAGGAEPVVILNKADLNDDTDDIVARIAEVAPQVPVQVVSAQSRRGLKALARWLVPGRTIALLGSSGVGKSTLINRLVGEPVQDTQEVRVADRKGRHTTTQRELLVAPSGVIVIDTPGLREIQPWDAGSGVDAAFEDVVALTTRCRFRDCTHTVEPGCAVQAALTDGSFAPQRWEAYQRMRMASGAQTPARPDREGGIRRKAEHKKAVKALRQRIHEKIGEE